MNKIFTTILTSQAHTNNSRQNQWKAYRASRTITAIKKKADKNTVITKSNKKVLPVKSTYLQLNISIRHSQLNLDPKNCPPTYSSKTMFLNSNKMKRMMFQIAIHNQHLIESL